jgi:microcystin-dependent protein
MAEPFLGELRLMSFNFAPKGWAQANGQLLPINQNQPLFSLFGTMYGGDGRVNFGLPDLRGRVPMHAGSGYVQGQKLGEEFHTLTSSETPTHNHIIQASSQNGDQAGPSILASVENTYRTADELTTINPETLDSVGGSQPHENRHPFTVLVWCVALQGIFPSRT